MKLLIFNRSFFNLSETFVYKQVKHLPSDIDVTLLGFNIVNEKTFPVDAKKIKLEEEVNKVDNLLTKIIRKITGKAYRFSVLNHLRVEKFLQREKFDLIHVHFGYNALQIFPIARKLNIPMVITFHGVDASPEFLKRDQYRNEIQELLEYASGIIMVSPHMIDTLQAAKWKNKIHFIPCCVDPSEFSGPKAPAEDNKIRLLHSGRLVSKKGVPDLVKVFIGLNQKYPGLQLDIIGDGPELEESKQLAKQANAGNIIFYGGQPQAEVKKLMAATDIFILNSRVGENGDMEGSPVSIQEAMSMQLPVVSTYHAGIPYIITDGKDGLLVPEKDNAALGAALEKLVNDKELRGKLGAAARVTVENKFTIAWMNKAILEVYKSVVSR